MNGASQKKIASEEKGRYKHMLEPAPLHFAISRRT